MTADVAANGTSTNYPIYRSVEVSGFNFSADRHDVRIRPEPHHGKQQDRLH
jgi:hypothetical protein